MKKVFAAMSIIIATTGVCVEEGRQEAVGNTPDGLSEVTAPRSVSEGLTEQVRQDIVQDARSFADIAASDITDIAFSRTIGDNQKIVQLEGLADELRDRSEGVQAISGQLYNKLHGLARRALHWADRVENPAAVQAHLAPASRQLFQDD